MPKNNWKYVSNKKFIINSETLTNQVTSHKNEKECMYWTGKIRVALIFYFILFVFCLLFIVPSSLQISPPTSSRLVPVQMVCLNGHMMKT